MNTCLNCEKEISGKAKYCSDKCRMAYQRRTKQGQQPEQIEPEHTRTADFELTRTDRLFDDHKPGYYNFGEVTRKETCLHCDKSFTTSLKLLRQCSPKCMNSMMLPSKAP